MSREEAHRAVLAFLDGFISRGAAAELHDLRQRLAADPDTRRLLDDRLSDTDLSAVEAYEGMIAFIDAAGEGTTWLSGESPGIRELASWIAVGSYVDGVPRTCDPGMWGDWLEAVEKARAPFGTHF